MILNNQIETYFSVVIPNWNGKHHLKECLEALRWQTFLNFEVILVDNGSTDDSIVFVRDNYPAVKILEFKVNHGFAGGVNEGIRIANGEYLVLLNNDTKVNENWLKNLASAIEGNPGVKIFASKLVNYYDRGLVDSAGDAMDLYLGPYKIGEGKPVENYSEPRFIFGACGGGSCYKRELFDRIGLFDEDFFAYLEDIDLSFRANWAGFRCLLVPDAVIYHKVGGTSEASQKSKDYFDALRRRNYIFLLIKNYPVSFLVRYLPFVLFVHGLKFFSYLLRGRFFVAFWIQWEIVKGIPKMLRKRRAIMANRRVSNAEVKVRCAPKYGGFVGFLKKKISDYQGA